MTERGNEFAEFAFDERRSEGVRSRTAVALFVVGLVVVAGNSALYFFGIDTLSHPALSVVGLALLVPLYLRER